MQNGARLDLDFGLWTLFSGIIKSELGRKGGSRKQGISLHPVPTLKVWQCLARFWAANWSRSGRWVEVAAACTEILPQSGLRVGCSRIKYGATNNLQCHACVSLRKVKVGMNAGEGRRFLVVVDLNLLNMVV